MTSVGTAATPALQARGRARPGVSDVDRDRSTPTVAARRVAILGCGVIGSHVARILQRDRAALQTRLGHALQLDRILVRDIDRERGVPQQLFTDRFETILDDRPDVVIELIGGVDPAAAFIEASLQRGIHVVTANKTVIARHGERLERIARRHRVHLAHEASVCAAIPLLASLRHLRGDRVRSICGIVNGSVNYILTRMSGDGLSFKEALDEARERGFIEPDPGADISGRDSVEKLCVLAAAAGCPGVMPEEVECSGIERLTRDDLLVARKLGFAVKLLAEFRQDGSRPRGRVGLTLIPVTHPLARVERERNAAIIDLDFGGELLLQGNGAGPAPTASAILGDLARVLNAPVECGQRTSPPGDASRIGSMDAPRRTFIRITARNGKPTPEETLLALRRFDIGVRHIEFGNAAIHALTNPVKEETLRRAIRWIVSDEDRVLLVPELCCPA